MASESKGKRLLFETFSNSSDAFKDKVNIFEYKAFHDVQELTPSKKISVFRNLVSFSPKFTIAVTNITIILILIAIGYGISMGISIATPKQYGDFCNSTSECSQNDHYVCSENKCKCPTGMFFTTTCVKQFGHLSFCTFKDKQECGYGLYCSYDSSGSSRCLCSTERYWNTDKNYCDIRFGFDQSGCTDSSQCQINTNLVCQTSKCTCVHPYYWNGTFCDLKSSYLQFCTIESGCDETKLLNCTIKGDHIYRCECDYTRFWSVQSNICTSKYLNDESCSISEECRTDLGLSCVTNDVTRKCQCDSNYFWDGNECMIKSNIGEACSISIPCNENQGLICNGPTCACPTNYFHDGTRCQYYIKTGLNCDGAFECDNTLGLSCDSSLNQCVCDTTHFWNYTTCVTKFLNGSSCINDIQCDVVKLLFCDLKNDLCLCTFDKYWDSTNQFCYSKLGIGQTCSQTFECQDYLGLICSTNCVCPTDYYWDGSKCSPQLSFNEDCTNSGHEPCLVSKGLVCSNIILNKCRCSDAEKYWNSVECVPKILHGQNCIYQSFSDQNNQCADYSPYSLICLATPYIPNSWTCQCKTTQYYDSTTNACINRKTFRESCVSSSQCEDYRGLICYSNSTCLCPSTQYWNNGCREKLPLNQPCTPTMDGANEPCQDFAFLFCISPANTCQCDDSRYYDTTFRACLPKSSHNQRCSENLHCFNSSPHPLTCLGNTCQCSNYNAVNAVHWSVTSKNCVNCPTGYTSGYGAGVYGSPNRITNRCYKVVGSNTHNFATARDNCITEGTRLITIRNIMELNIVKIQFWSNNYNFILGSRTTVSKIFTWDYDGGKPVQNTFFCPGQPNDAGTNLQDLLIFERGYCLNDLGDSSSFSYICEKE